jgi:hypothetical protein
MKPISEVEVPEPSEAGDDPTGLAKASFFFMLLVGFAWGLGKAGMAIVGRPVRNTLTGGWSNIRSAASGAANNAESSWGDY